MANQLVRDKVKAHINAAISEAQIAAEVDHPGMMGTIREIAIKNLFGPLLTGQTDIGSGKIIDFNGFQSQETDVIIYSKNIHPAILYSHRTDIGIYPAETCIYAIEVKSKATASNIRDVIEKGKTLRNLKYSTGLYDPFGRGISHQITPVIPAFFAFGTDLSEKSEIDRYIELDPEGEFSPVIPVICVAGKGYWYYRRDTTPSGDSIGKWWHWAPSTDYNEIFGFLSGILNTIPDAVASRGRPRFGEYLLPEVGMPAKEYFWRFDKNMNTWIKRTIGP